MMFKKISVLMLSCSLSMPVAAVSCYITLAKASCWAAYDVVVDVVDAGTGAVLTSMAIPQGQSWLRAPFKCYENQTLSFKAQYSPVIWQGEAHKIYSSQQYVQLPSDFGEGTAAWNTSVCYASDFAQVTMPPTGSDNCVCDFTGIPAIDTHQ